MPAVLPLEGTDAPQSEGLQTASLKAGDAQGIARI